MKYVQNVLYEFILKEISIVDTSYSDFSLIIFLSRWYLNFDENSEDEHRERPHSRYTRIDARCANACIRDGRNPPFMRTRACASLAPAARRPTGAPLRFHGPFADDTQYVQDNPHAIHTRVGQLGRRWGENAG